MKTQTLTIQAIDLNSNEWVDLIIFASNPFMLYRKVVKMLKNNSVQSWRIVNRKWEAGNTGLNAEAYLYETVENLLENF